ncbi:MAG: slipin family protein [SAR324 cluster bacterium]|nr:slipin family protein [SAR324 cluster bacterium]MCZ6842065.1 slipin family protein [SAR324 cluster bacterium]
MLIAIGVSVVVVLGILIAAVRILPEYERGVIFRLGRAIGVKGPGLILLIPLVDKMRRVSLRTIVLDIPPQDVITKDNVSMKVNAVNYFRVVDPMKAIIEVEDFLYATGQLAQTTLRAVVGQVELDEVLSDRDVINRRLQEILDLHTDPWGIKVSQVELKDVDLPKEMQRSIARQAEAERDRRAKIILAKAEEMAAQHLRNAADILGQDPVAVQLRFMQTLIEITGPNNTTTIVPIPVDLISNLMDMFRRRRSERETEQDVRKAGD